MSPTLIQLIIFGTLAGLANVFGGLLLLPSRVHRHARSWLTYVLAGGAGFMLSVTFFEILPATVTLWFRPEESEHSLYLPMLLFLGGYLLTQLVEHTIAPHFHLGEEVHGGELISRTSAYTAIAGLFVHTFFDGISIAAASEVSFQIGALVFIAIVVHKLPEGFTIGSMVLAAGKTRRDVVLTTAAIGFTTLAGVLAFYAVGSWVSGSVAYALPVSGGVALYVAASDLIPEVNHHSSRNVSVSIAILIGILLFYAGHSLLSTLGPF